MDMFESKRIGNLIIKNRLAVAPMTRVSANKDGTINELIEQYYENYACGNFGLIITEGLYTDDKYSQGYLHQPGIINEMQANSWQPVVERIHNYGTKIIAQLMHAGALSQFNKYSNESAGPSAIRPLGEQMSFYYGNGTYAIPNEMTLDDINDVIEGYVNAAIHAQLAGFDGVEVHGANGYLLDQFLTDYTNSREDKYGGSIENRLRIFQEIIEAIRAKVGREFIIGVRFSQKKVNDTDYVWKEGEVLAKASFSYLEDIGANYIHTTEPMISAPAFGEGMSLAKLAKTYSNLPVIANGGINRKEDAAEILNNKLSDIVAIGKAALANPNWPIKAESDTEMTAFEFSMLAPIANLECADNYLRSK